ncbi:predicted protein [Plenodomus lingam JN3]|uniref:Uncharacterized protein n=1 Tax=Leptosphaeria maculans (strain JN3 / isolate v23.1.3 / race Av1-4-5-6-7-8) TaxID=985895 RepID=E5A6S1_LEPMJ|nr:predicted protein [Plenodomus lingam JN3]CBX99316.1 predicted protein [Plenodomus lingam JN3]
MLAASDTYKERTITSFHFQPQDSGSTEQEVTFPAVDCRTRQSLANRYTSY